MPKQVYFPPDAGSSGIDITWTPRAQRIDVSGWYDGCVGIPGEQLSLREFFKRLSITEIDCAKAFAE